MNLLLVAVLGCFGPDQVADARALARNGQRGLALEKLENLLKDDPTNVRAYVALGDIHFTRALSGEGLPAIDLQKAIEYYSGVIKQEPQHPQALARLGLAENARDPKSTRHLQEAWKCCQSAEVMHGRLGEQFIETILKEGTWRVTEWRRVVQEGQGYVYTINSDAKVYLEPRDSEPPKVVRVAPMGEHLPLDGLETEVATPFSFQDTLHPVFEERQGTSTACVDHTQHPLRCRKGPCKEGGAYVKDLNGNRVGKDVRNVRVARDGPAIAPPRGVYGLHYYCPVTYDVPRAPWVSVDGEQVWRTTIPSAGERAVRARRAGLGDAADQLAADQIGIGLPFALVPLGDNAKLLEVDLSEEHARFVFQDPYGTFTFVDGVLTDWRVGGD